MLAILAIVCFILYTVSATLWKFGPHEWLGLGLVFLAIALVYNPIPYARRRNAPPSNS